MTQTTREKMIAGALDLLSRHGVYATSLREVVQHTGTPRGSIAHHFPGGKRQLLQEALQLASDQVAAPLAALTAERGAVAGLRAFVDWWRRVLVASDFRAGCPVLAVAVEPLAGDAAEAVADNEALRAQVHAAFARWQAILTEALRAEGLAPARAARLAALVLAAVEGTVAMCRAARSAQPLDEVHQELEAALAAAIAAARG